MKMKRLRYVVQSLHLEYGAVYGQIELNSGATNMQDREMSGSNKPWCGGNAGRVDREVGEPPTSPPLVICRPTRSNKNPSVLASSNPRSDISVYLLLYCLHDSA